MDVLYGAVNPSGRLVYTIAKNLSDYGIGLVTGGDADTLLSIPFTEGLFVDYRHFDQVRSTHVLRTLTQLRYCYSTTSRRATNSASG